MSLHVTIPNGDYKSGPYRAFVCQREKEIQEWNEQKLSEVLPGFSGGGLPGRSTKEAGREEEEEKEKSEERRITKGIAQEVVDGIKEKVILHLDAMSTARRAVGQSVMHSWDCSQIENEEEEEVENWQKENKLEVIWEEHEKLEKILERRSMERSLLQAEIMQKVLEEMKDKHEQSFGGRHRRNEEM